MTQISEKLSTALAGRYRIERRLGEGGMATVYLAEDVKHDRKVAVKVLRPELAAVLGAERFVQEIKTTAGMQHPHILPLHDSGEAGSFLYYVMPYIDGETLRDKLDRETQLGVDEAVKITTEVADALDYAHRNNVIHRDIKPENILLHDGRPMVADFGIALAVSAAAGGRMTETGLSLGTPYYMSPEQATADKDLTNRSDIYSLGAMLYEMLTGDPPHTGSSAQQIIMKIVTEDAPPITKMRKSVPSNVAAAVARALEKLPADRFETAEKFSNALTNPAFTGPSAGGAVAGTPVSRSPLTLGLAALSAFLFITTFVGWLRPRGDRDPETPEIAALFSVGTDVRIDTRSGFSLSPDGERLAFVGRDAEGRRAIWIRPMREELSTVVSGTEGAEWPFWSPDGRSLGFTRGDALVTTDLQTGAGRWLCGTGDLGPGGGAWSEDGVIVFPAHRVIYRVDADGGDCLPVTDTLGWVQTHPRFLPDGRRFIFADLYGYALYVAELDSREVQPLLEGGTNPHFVQPDWLLYTSGPLLARRVDLATLNLIGDPGVAFRRISMPVGIASYTAAANGIFLGVPRETTDQRLVWVGMNGVTTDTVHQPGDDTWQANVTRDGRFIAFGGFELWIQETSRGIPERINLTSYALEPAWSPGDSLVAFHTGASEGATASGGATQRLRLYRIASGVEETLWEGPDVGQKAWTPDGEAIVFASDGRLWSYSMRDQEARPLSMDPIGQASRVVGTSGSIEFSPDGRWLLYGAGQTAADLEVYVRSYPELTPPRRVSSAGGSLPRWSADGRTIYYASPTGDIMAASFGENGNGSLGEVRRVLAGGTHEGLYGVSPDGERFLRRPTTEDVTPVRLITRWQERVLRSAGTEVGN